MDMLIPTKRAEHAAKKATCANFISLTLTRENFELCCCVCFGGEFLVYL